MINGGSAAPSRAIRLRVLGLFLLLATLFLFWKYSVPRFDPGSIRLPEGFHLSLYADKVPDARGLAVGDRGTVFVGSFDAGRVYALVDRNGDHRADTVYVLADGLALPTGVAFRDGALYVAEVGRILRFDSIETRLSHPPAPVVVTDSLPTESYHGWKYLRFGPDGSLYIPVGAPCNVCRPSDERFGTILRLRPDSVPGDRWQIWARGVRNSVGFDLDPATGALWFSDNGRDGMSDTLPPDEINVAPGPGLHFGFPHCFGQDVPDPDFGRERGCESFQPPAAELPAHVAPLGVRFYTGSMFPETYHGQMFVAEHGSWDRSPPAGYRITRIRLEEGRVVEYAVFADGWLRGRWAWGRPVDVLVMPDGALLVSDDRAGVVYRIAYGG